MQSLKNERFMQGLDGQGCAFGSPELRLHREDTGEQPLRTAGPRGARGVARRPPRAARPPAPASPSGALPGRGCSSGRPSEPGASACCRRCVPRPSRPEALGAGGLGLLCAL